jgi:hypothetical protein
VLKIYKNDQIFKYLVVHKVVKLLNFFFNWYPFSVLIFLKIKIDKKSIFGTEKCLISGVERNEEFN